MPWGSAHTPAAERWEMAITVRGSNVVVGDPEYDYTDTITINGVEYKVVGKNKVIFGRPSTSTAILTSNGKNYNAVDILSVRELTAIKYTWVIDSNPIPDKSSDASGSIDPTNGVGSFEARTTAVPEPSTVWMAITGTLALAGPWGPKAGFGPVGSTRKKDSTFTDVRVRRAVSGGRPLCFVLVADRITGRRECRSGGLWHRSRGMPVCWYAAPGAGCVCGVQVLGGTRGYVDSRVLESPASESGSFRPDCASWRNELNESEEAHPPRRPARRPASPREATLRRRRVVRAGFREGISPGSPEGEFVQNTALLRHQLEEG